MKPMSCPNINEIEIAAPIFLNSYMNNRQEINKKKNIIKEIAETLWQINIRNRQLTEVNDREETKY